MSKYIDYKLIILFAIIPIVLVVLFPSPFFNVWYDSEPDYFSNTLSMLINTHPVDYIHPGLTINYLSSLFIKLFGNYDSAESLIITLRLLLTYINLFIIYFSMIVLGRSENYHVYLFVILILIHPSNFYYFDILKPNILLSSLGVLIAILGANLQKKPLIFSFFYGVILGVGIATKYSFILMTLPLIISIILSVLRITSTRVQISKILLLLISFFITTIVLFFPIMPMMPFYLTLWKGVDVGLNFGLSGINISDFLVYFLIFIFIFGFLILAIKNFLWKDKDVTFNFVYLQCSKLILLFLVYIFFADIINKSSYQEISISQRNLLPLLGFLGLFLHNKNQLFRFQKLKFYIIYLLIFILSLKAYANYSNYKTSILIDYKFNSNINKLIEDQNDIVFFPSSKFVSKDYFILWSDYRYGDRIESFYNQRKLMPFHIDEKFNELHILNYRSFDLPEEFESKFSYKYFKYLLNSNLTLQVHKNLLNNHLELMYKDDPCVRPYNGFEHGKQFMVIIPDNLRYRETSKFDIYKRKDGSFVDRDSLNYSAQSIAENLKNYWSNICNFDVSSFERNFADNNSIFLKVDTR